MNDRNQTRFWSKVDRSASCWMWTGEVDTHGYGVFRRRGRPAKAHLIAYQITNAPVPQGRDVEQSCGSRRCVNPAHLHLWGEQS
jgi:hypothetical protein